MKIFIFYSFLFFFFGSSFAGNVQLLHAKEWSIPKKATTLLAMPSIKNSMNKLKSNVHSTLKIKHPGGDEGTLWVNELRSWLVALGLSSKRIKLEPGSAISITIELEVISR